MTPNETLQYYTALKLHFSSESYDGVKYQWKLKRPVDYTKRNDKHFFNKLSRHDDPKGLLISNLSSNPSIWIGDLFLHEAQERYSKWKSYREASVYRFGEDLKKLNKDSFKVIDGQHPDAFQKYLRQDVTIDTMAICEYFIHYMFIWEQKLKDDPVWIQSRLALGKYMALDWELIQTNHQGYKKALKNWLTNDP